jgi:endoglucanase
MALDLAAHLKALCAVPGLPGYEQPVAALLRAAWGPLTASLGQDRLGSLWATRPGSGLAPRRRLMLAAHMDAIGLMVASLQGDFLRVTHLGDLDLRVLPGQLVTVHAAGGDLPGVLALPPAHLLPRAHREGFPPVAELLVDTGLPAERVGALVRPGDLVSFAQPPRELLNGAFTARGLDNRASLAALTVCLEALQARDHAWDVIAVATVREEPPGGYPGAAASAYSLEPHLAIVLDVTFGQDANTREFGYRVFPLGGGPVLGLGPNLHPGLHAALRAAADAEEIPYTVEVMTGNSSTDATAIQVAREGIPTMLVSIPLRNMHTPVEVVALKDITRAGRLVAEFAARLGPDSLAALALD